MAPPINTAGLGTVHQSSSPADHPPASDSQPSVNTQDQFVNTLAGGRHKLRPTAPALTPAQAPTRPQAPTENNRAMTAATGTVEADKTSTQASLSDPTRRRGLVYINPNLLEPGYEPPKTGEVSGSGHW